MKPGLLHSLLILLLTLGLCGAGRAQEERDREVREIEGTIFSIDRERETMRLRVAAGEYVTVELHRETAFRRETGARIAFADLRVGNVVVVTGARRDRSFVGDAVRVLRGSDRPPEMGRPSEAVRDAMIEGTVRRPTRTVTRRLRIRTQQGDVTVDVPKEIPIIRDFERLSVHDLQSGDRVRVQGSRTSEDRLRASRILVASRVDGRFTEEAASGSAPGLRGAVLEGSVVSLDEARTRVRIQQRSRTYVIRTEAARVMLGDRVVGRGALRPGDRIRATGRLHGTELFAQKIEIQ